MCDGGGWNIPLGGGGGGGAFGEDQAEHRNKEGSCFARASLRTRHQVTPSEDYGQGILLHWSGPGIGCQLQ